MPSPFAVPIVLTAEERAQLEAWARRRTSAQALALRSRIVLAASEGPNNTEIARDLGVAVSSVRKWRNRFAEHRLDGLTDEPRSGQPRKITDGKVEEVIVKTLESTPKDATHWSTRSMAAEVGLKRCGLGGDLEAAGAAVDADGDGDGFEEAGGDEAGRAAVEVQERVGGLVAVDAVLVAESDDGVGESCSLLGGVDPFGDGGECVPTPVGIVVLDCFTEALKVGTDQLGERDQQRVVDAGEIDEAVPEVVERVVGEPGEVGDRLSGELGDVSAGELVFGGAASLSAAAFDLAA